MLDVVAAMREPNESSSARHDAEAQPSERIREPRARRKRRRNVLLLLLGLLVVAVCAGMLWRHFSSYETTDDAQVDAHLYPVSARVHGYVIRVNADDNEYVQQGTLLVEVDPRDYEVAVDQARADLANAEATAQSLHIDIPITATNTSSQLQSTAADVEKGEAGIVAAQKQLAAAEAQLQQDQANDVKAQHDLARYQMLVEKEEVSRQVYDSALAAARASAAAVNAGAANVESARQSVEQARSVLTSAQAGHRAAETAPHQVAATRARAVSAEALVKQKRAALEQAELNLAYTKITAPVAGLVRKTVVVGMNVQPGQQLLTMVPLQDVWVTANFKETQLQNIHPGQSVVFYSDSNGRSYNGHVDSIAGATGPLFSLLPPENATGNYVKIVQRIPVKIVLEPGQNSDLQLRPGVNVVPKVYLR
jgi:membrane fusion protein, multidrug efflux system